jgi:hypothetical protein
MGKECGEGGKVEREVGRRLHHVGPHLSQVDAQSAEQVTKSLVNGQILDLITALFTGKNLQVFVMFRSGGAVGGRQTGCLQNFVHWIVSEQRKNDGRFRGFGELSRGYFVEAFRRLLVQIQLGCLPYENKQFVTTEHW